MEKLKCFMTLASCRCLLLLASKNPEDSSFKMWNKSNVVSTLYLRKPIEETLILLSHLWSQTLLRSDRGRKSLKQNSSLPCNDKEKCNSSQNWCINCHRAATVYEMLDSWALSHQSELFPSSCYRHFLTVPSFTISVRSKKLSRGDLQWRRGTQNKGGSNATNTYRQNKSY